MSYKRNIWLFHLASFISYFELVASLFVLFLLGNGLSMTQVMILQGVFAFTILLFEIPSGIFADLFGLKRTLMISNMMIGLGFAIYALSKSFWPFFFAEIIVGIAFSLRSGTSTAFLYDSLKETGDEKEFGRQVSFNYSLIMVALGLAAIAGGLLAKRFELWFVYLLSSLSYLSAVFIMFFFKEPKSFKKVGDRNFLKHFKESMHLSKASQIKRLIVYYAFFSGFTYFIFYFIQPYLVINGADFVQIGIVVSTYFFIYAIGNYFGRFKVKRVLFYSISIFSLCMILIGFVPFYLGMVLLLFAAFISAFKEIVVEEKFNHLAKSSHRATMLSIKNMSMNLVFTIFSPLLGYVSDLWDIRAAFLMIGVSLSLFTLFFLAYYMLDKSPGSDVFS